MKKQTAMALAAVFAMSVAGTALAATTNPFVDVPAKHWSYDSINQLAKAGVISGYGDGTYQGDKTLTRYEAATLVAKAMANADKLNPENQKALEALKTEFSAELNNLGVRVSNIENRLDNVKVSGDYRLRYDHVKHEQPGIADTSESGLIGRSRVAFSGSVNDQWSFTGRVQNSSSYRKVGSTTTEFNQAYVTGKVFGGTYNFGRQDVFVLDGLVMDNTGDSNFRGASVNYTIGKVGVTGFYGTQDTTDVFLTPTTETYSALAATGKAGKVDWGVAYHKFSNSPNNSNVWQVSAAVPVAENLGLALGYAKSNLSTDNKAYTLKLNYKSFDQTKAGTFGAWLQYRRTEAKFVGGGVSTYDETNVANGGAKAWEIGFDYAPWKNVQWETYYITADSLKDGSKDRQLTTYLRYFF